MTSKKHGHRNVADPGTTVCVQGLGFVGAAMAIAVASACDECGEPWAEVVGVELDTPEGRAKASAIAAGRLPFDCGDAALVDAALEASERGNLTTTTDPAAFSRANVVVVDVPFGVALHTPEPRLKPEIFLSALRTLGDHVCPRALVLIETTVPPGTTERLAEPLLRERLRARGEDPDTLLLAHSYERVMPGEQYLESLVAMPRVYAGTTEHAAIACGDFLARIIDTKRTSLTRLSSTVASELGKLLENSYRAVNIAFIEEWGRLAEAAGVDLFDVIDAIRQRPTHANLRQPGFGVGGYCLTKDPLLAGLGAKELLGIDGLSFPFSERAVAINRDMPLVALARLESMLGGDLRGYRILLLGVSYRPDVGDTRCSAAEAFVRAALERGAEVIAHDPRVKRWEELQWNLPDELPAAPGFDAVIFALADPFYTTLDTAAWLDGATPAILDANRVLPEATRASLRARGCRVESVGRGDGL